MHLVAQRRKDRMGRPLTRIISTLPARRQRRIEKRSQELKHEIESLRELREIAGKAQIDVAAALKIKQPSVSKIENQTDMYLSTLRGYVEAIGGELELVVRLTERPVVRLYRLGDAIGCASRSPQRGARPRHRPTESS
jgi:Helix-turn-helix domain